MDFKIKLGNKTFIASKGKPLRGWTDDWSAIQSRLIKLAARHCKQYASDIILDIRAIDRDAAEENLKPFYLFGFRQLGVDGTEFIKSRISMNGAMGEHKVIYAMIIGERFRKPEYQLIKLEEEN